MSQRVGFFIVVLGAFGSFHGAVPAPAWSATITTMEMSAATLDDRIRGGLLGQILGNLNGLPHEMKYIDEPGNVTEYTPSLPEGAHTDDDTDIEWVYIVAMEKAGKTLLAPAEIAALWEAHINESIWCSNNHARQMMTLGIHPPLTGRIALNPWSDFNISGQFLCESFGLIAPAMPQTAGRIGLNYTHVGIEGEPAQTTQLFTTMISTAFTTDDIEKILDAGVASVDERSVIREIVAQIRRWHREHPDSWRVTRKLTREKYSRHGGEMRDKNGYELNTAATIAALLYGKGDFTETLRLAFNMGWDCDNNAATAATIIGVIKGHRQLRSQGWEIVDRYRNTCRKGMPEDETITKFGDRLVAVAELVIAEQGGKKQTRNGKTVFVIQMEAPGNVVPLEDPTTARERLMKELTPTIEAGLQREASPRAQARAAYYAVALDVAENIRKTRPEDWERAVGALNETAPIRKAITDAHIIPRGKSLYERAVAAGVRFDPK
jgi:ADP-ribosylglycohydrolase